MVVIKNNLNKLMKRRIIRQNMRIDKCSNCRKKAICWITNIGGLCDPCYQKEILL